MKKSDKVEAKLQKAMRGWMEKTCSYGHWMFLKNSTKSKVG